MKKTSQDIQEIFDYWVKVMNKPKAKLIPARTTKIKARLKEGYTVDEVKLAVDGCAKSPHNMGDNDRCTVYDDIELICRNGVKLERFIAIANKPKHFNESGFKPVHAHQQGFLDSLNNDFIEGNLIDEK